MQEKLWFYVNQNYKEINGDVLEAQKAQERLTEVMARLGEIGEPVVTGFKNTKELTNHISSTYYNPKNAVLVGARDMEDEEIVNLKNAGVTVFSTNDLKQCGNKPEKMWPHNERLLLARNVLYDDEKRKKYC